MTIKKLIIGSIPMTAVLGLTLLSGCNSDGGDRAQDFSAPGDPTEVGRVADAQAAKGAYADAMLYPRHFEGNILNSAGRKKLHEIVCATPANLPVVIYLNMSKDAAATCQPVVLAYLKDAGVNDDSAQIVVGSNPNTNHATAYDLQQIYKAEGTSYNGEGADAAAGSAPAPMK